MNSASRKYPKSFAHEHDTVSIRTRLQKGIRQSYLKDFVYGAIDGTVTTFAVVSGVEGAELQTSAILILGAANLFADGFSMAMGNFLSTKTENDQRALAEEFENRQIERMPKGEVREVREILRRRGYSGDFLEKNVQFTIAERSRWVNTMLEAEYGIAGPPKSPLKSGIYTFAAFVLFGAIPLLTYLFEAGNPFFWATLLTGFAFTLIGALKSRWTIQSPTVAGLQTLALGSTAAAISYVVGSILRQIAL